MFGFRIQWVWREVWREFTPNHSSVKFTHLPNSSEKKENVEICILTWILLEQMQEFYGAAGKGQPQEWFSSLLTHWQSSQMRKAPSVASSWLSWMSTLITCTGWHVSCSLEFKSVQNKTQQQTLGGMGSYFTQDFKKIQRCCRIQIFSKYFLEFL